ncbi:MAG TPA: response regulator [Candidatus Omnitrophota bacterium]|nr:response regulator [Candidatus Omnitrophota bacterium]HPT06595.1 response regulator [Candidatus Omnitrophota bacterium]
MENTARVLVVDDEPDVLFLTKTQLELAGYQVFTAFNGRSALEGIRANKPALVILDIMLPDMDGFEVLRQIRNDPEIAHIPVLLHTAHKAMEVILRTKRELTQGRQEFLFKDVSSEVFLSQVEAMLKPHD